MSSAGVTGGAPVSDGSAPRAAGTGHPPETSLADLSEAQVLAAILPWFPTADGVLVGPGDDAAIVAAPSGSVIATTDSMLRGRDWRDDWSTGHDVGVKVVAQNLADVAAMGGVPTGLLVALAADPATPLGWVVDLARGIATAARSGGAPVVGGDLSSAPAGVVVVAVTALGDLEGRAPVLRSGARAGDVVALHGSLGWSGAGLALYEAGERRPAASGAATEHDRNVAALMDYHRAPRPSHGQGPVASRCGATAMIDISDGLVRDAGRVASASGVTVELFGAVLRERYAAGMLTEVLGPEEAMRQVLGGGEEHSLLACFATEAAVPLDEGSPWRVIGQVVPAGPDGPQVSVDAVVAPPSGWDHFAR